VAQAAGDRADVVTASDGNGGRPVAQIVQSPGRVDPGRLAGPPPPGADPVRVHGLVGVGEHPQPEVLAVEHQGLDGLDRVAVEDDDPAVGGLGRGVGEGDGHRVAPAPVAFGLDGTVDRELVAGQVPPAQGGQLGPPGAGDGGDAQREGGGGVEAGGPPTFRISECADQR
jgi:hypothetical protein